MPVTPLAIISTGMVTPVGLDSASSCAAIRCAIDNFGETRFIDAGGEWQIGSEVRLEKPWRGRTKLLKMAAMSISECLAAAGTTETTNIPLFLCLPESDRPGRMIADDDLFFADLQNELGMEFAARSRVLCHGHTAVVVGLKHARDMIDSGQANNVIIAGVDSLLSAAALRQYQENERLLTSQNSNGFIPGEGAACLLLGKHSGRGATGLLIHGVGFGVEKARLGSGLPLRADGLKTAINASLAETGCQMHDLDYRITDMTGEHYYFKEASLALSRTLKQVKPEFDILHPTDCVGEAGAAIGPTVLCYQNYFSRVASGKRIMAHFGDTDGKRAAVVLSYSGAAG